MDDTIFQLGFTEQLLQKASFYEGLIPGQVISQSRDIYHVATSAGELTAEISERFRYGAARRGPAFYQGQP